MKKLIPHGNDFSLIITRAELEHAGIDLHEDFNLTIDQIKPNTKKSSGFKKISIKKQPDVQKAATHVIKKYTNLLAKLAKN